MYLSFAFLFWQLFTLIVFLFFLFASMLPAWHFFFLHLKLRGLNSEGARRIIPVDSGMGVEDWESKYKIPDSGVLDEYLDTEQKMWEEEDRSIIYRISDSQSESKGSRFYQIVECDALSTEDVGGTRNRSQGQKPEFGSGEVRLVYKQAGSFEDDSSPPEIDIIPSVKQQREPINSDSLLYRTRLWAKTALEGTLENYAAFCEEEAAREEAARIRERIEYGSVDSDEMQFSFGSEEELDDLTFTEGDASYEYESYYYNDASYHGDDSVVSPVEEPSDEYVDAMGELKILINSVSEYLAVKEEEINQYESMPKPVRRKLPALPTDAPIVEPGEDEKSEVKPDVKEDGAVEQGMTGVKNAMSSLFSSITGTKTATDAQEASKTPSPQPSHEDSGISKLLHLIPKSNMGAKETSSAAAADPPTPQASPQPDSGISRLLSFIPKSGGTSPPVAVVPPATQEPGTEKKFFLQSLLPFQSSETSQQSDASQAAPSGAESSGAPSNQSTSAFESVLGRLSPMRLFSSAPSSRETSPQPTEQERASVNSESREASVGRTTGPSSECSQSERCVSAETRPDSGSGSVELLSDVGSGSVELLPETESSGELPEIQQRRPSPLSEPKPESSSEGAGFFSPFRKSLSSLISAAPPENPPQTDKTQEETFLGSKVKIPFLSSENVSATPKAEGSMLSGILKFASGETNSVAQKDSSPSPARTPSPSRAALLESVPKANTETGWFSNLFKVSSNEPAKDPVKPAVTPTVILTKPPHPNEPHSEVLCSDTPKSTESGTESSQKQQSDNDLCITSDVQPKSGDSKDQCPQLDEQAKTQTQGSQAQGILSGLLKLGSAETPSPEAKTQGGDSQPQQGGLFSGLFLSASSPQAQQSSGAQQSGGLLSGFLKLGTDSASPSTDNSSRPGQSGKTQNQQAGQPAAPQTPMGGLLSGLLKKATDTVTGPQPTQSTPELQQNAADEQGKSTESLRNASQESSPNQLGGFLSGLNKLGSSVASLTNKDQPGQDLKQPVDPDTQLKPLDPAAGKEHPREATDSAQSGGLFGGLLKLTEAVSPAPKEPQASQATQSQPGNMLSGLFNKIVESNSAQSQRPSDPSAQATNQTQSHQAAPQQGGFLSGLFGIGSDSAPATSGQASQNQPKSGSSEPQPSQPTGNRQNLQRQKHVPPQQPSSTAGGMFSGLLNKLAESGSPQPAMGSQPDQQQAPKPQQPQNQQGGFLSGLFSGGSTPSVTHPNQQQPQQAARQPLRRQNQIPPQSGASQPEPQQQSSLLSGLFNKLASTDNPPQQPSPQTGVQHSKSDSAGPSEESSQSSQQGGFLSGLFGQSSSPQTQPKSGKEATPHPSATTQANQSPGLFSGILNLASGENTPQEQHRPAPSKPSVNSGQTPERSESGSILSGLMNKISVSADQSSSKSDQAAQQQQQPRAGQGRPQIQRTKPVEMHPGQDSAAEKDGKDLAQKGFLSGLFGVKDEVPSKTSPPLEKDAPQTSGSATSPGLLSSIFKTGLSERSSLAPGKEAQKGVFDHLLQKSTDNTTLTTTTSATVVNNDREALQSQVVQEPTVSPTQRYLEEIQRLLYGTEREYGYKDLLYNFTEHGVILPDLYEHQCLIEALLWQQLNDYALAEALANQVQEHSRTCQEYAPPTVRMHEPQTHLRLNPMEMDISNFYIPSHPWKDAANQLFESRNRFLEPDEDLVLFDMRCRDKNHWGSCDHLDDLNRNKKSWITEGTALNLSTEKPKPRLSRCQSVTECSTQEFSRIVNRSGKVCDLKVEDFSLKSATEFLKQLSKKMGPMDLRRGAVDLSRSAGATGEEDDLMVCQDAEWYQQWLSLLEQGLWWPAEVGDCGYYVYTDEEYIYSLLTDRAGRHLYSCAAPEDVQALANITENIANILKQEEREKLTLCGFKIPLCSEDFWVPGEQQNHFAPLQAPMNLTSALHKGEKIMNMNFESFSQMFQESMSSQDQPVDFSVYKLKKIKVEAVKSAYFCQEDSIEASDLTLKALKEGHGRPYWKNERTKDVPTFPSTPLSKACSVQTSSNRRYPVPEIRIAHVDNDPSDTLAQKPASKMSPIRGTTGINKSDKLASTRPTASPSASSKVSDTPTVSAVSKSSGSLQMGRTLPTLPAATQASSKSPGTDKSSVTSSTTVPSLSTQRPRLARQPSQAEKTREQASKTTVTEMSVVSKTDLEQQQKSPPECKPQLHILNDNSVSSNDAHLYKQSRNFGTPIGCHSSNKVLDFSTTFAKSKTIKQREAASTNTELTQKEVEVVDFTKYKLKRFQEKQAKDTDPNVKLSHDITVAIDLTQQNKEEDVEWPNLDNSTMDMSTVLTSAPQSKFIPPNHHKTSGEPTNPDVSVDRIASERLTQKINGSLRTSTAVTVQTNVTTTTTITKGESENVFEKPSTMSSGRVSRLSNTGLIISTSIRSSTTHTYSQASTMSDDLKRSKKATSLPPIGALPFKHPVVGIKNGSGGQVQHPKETTAPANSVKATLDMSTKKTNQQQRDPQVVVPLKDPLSEVLALTKKKTVSFEEADTIPCPYESLDLSFTWKTSNLHNDTNKYSNSKHVEDFSVNAESMMAKCPDSNLKTPSCHRRPAIMRQESLSGQSSQSQNKVAAPASIISATLDMTCKSSVQPKAMVPEMTTNGTQNEAIPLMKDKRNMTALNNTSGVPLIVDAAAQESQSQVKIGSPANRQQTHPDQFQSDSVSHQQRCQQSKPCDKHLSSHSSQHSSVIAARHHTPASTQPVIAALDMSPRPKQCAAEVVLEDRTAHNEVIALVNKHSARAVSEQESVGVSLVIESKPRESASQDSIPSRKLPSFDAKTVLHHPLTSSNEEQLLGKGERRGISQSSLQNAVFTAPANSVKGTIDMSTRVCKPEDDFNYSDPVSLVRTRRASLADSAGVPLIVEAHPPKDRQQTVVEPEERMQQCEITATYIKNNRVDQHALERRRLSLSGGISGTLNRQTSTHHNHDGFSPLVVANMSIYQRSMPVNFSSKDDSDPVIIHSADTDQVDGQPMNFTNDTAKKDWCERTLTRKETTMKPSQGIVDLSVDQFKSTVNDLQDATDLTSPNVSSLSLCSQNTVHHRKPGVPYGMLPGTAINPPAINNSGSSLVSGQWIQSSQKLLKDESATCPINTNTQQQCGYSGSKMLKQLPQQSLAENQYQQPGVEIGMSSFSAESQPKAPKLQRQAPNVQDTNFRPRILIKQPTMESYGSTDELLFENEGMASNEHAPPPTSTWQLHNKSGPVSFTQAEPLSIKQQPHEGQRANASLASFGPQTVQMNTTRPSQQQQSQPDSHPALVKDQQCPATILHLNSVSSNQFSPVKRHESTFQSSTIHAQRPETQTFGARVQGPEVLPTSAGATSVKSLVSLFSGESTHPPVTTRSVATTPQHTQDVPIIVKNEIKTEVTALRHSTVPPQVSVASSSLEHCKEIAVPAAPIAKTDDSCQQIPVVSSSLPCIQASAGNQEDTLSPQTGVSTSSIDHPAAMAPETSPVTDTVKEHTSFPGAVSCSETPLQGDHSPYVSQDYQQPQSKLNESLERATSGKEFQRPEILSNAPLNVTVAGTLTKGIGVESKEQTSDISSQICIQPQSLEDDKQVTSAENVVNSTKMEISPPRSMYISINSSEKPPLDPDEPQPYIRLPHIFVTAASSPEEDTADHKLDEPEEPKISTLQDNNETVITSDGNNSLPPDIVALSNSTSSIGGLETINTEVLNKSEQDRIDSTKMTADHSHESDSECSANKIGSAAKAETTEASIEQQTKLDSSINKDIVLEPVLPDLSEIPKEPVHENKTLDVILPRQAQSSDELTVKTELDGKILDDIKDPKDNALFKSESSVMEPPTKTTTSSKEESYVNNVNQPESGQSEEHPGKGLFSMFSGPSTKSEQTASQAGLSILGGIIPGSSSKATSGTLLSMFGSNVSSSPISKEPPLVSTPGETQSKSKFSLFGSNVGGDPTNETTQPKGTKEPPGKGLFSMFSAGASGPQQQSSRDQSARGALPKGPTSGSSIFGGILPGSTSQKETPGVGFFSKLGSLSAQPQSGPVVTPPGPKAPPTPKDQEPTVKSVFSMFNRQSQQPSEAQPTASKAAESDNAFNVASVFSLGGGTDSNKGKTAFSLFGKSLKEETKTEPETTVPAKRVIVSDQSEKTSETTDHSKAAVAHVDEVADTQLPVPSSSVEMESQIVQSCTDSNLRNDAMTEISSLDPHLERNNGATMKPDICSNENDSAETEQASLTITAPEKDTYEEHIDATVTLEEQAVIQPQSKEMEDTEDACKDDAESKPESLEIQKSDDVTECAPIQNTVEKGDSAPEVEIVAADTDTNKSPDTFAEGQEKSVEEGAQNKDPLNVLNEEQTEAVEKSNKEPQGQAEGGDMEKSTADSSEVGGDQQGSITETEKPDGATLEGSAGAAEEKSSAEPGLNAITAASESVQIADVEVNFSPDKPVPEPAQSELEHEGASKTTDHGLERPDSNSAALISDENKSVHRDSQNIPTTPGLPTEPAVHQPQKQPVQGAACPPVHSGQRMAAPGLGGPQVRVPRMPGPRMSGPRMPGARMPGPRHPGPQKPPEPAPFSGFMSMFSTPSVSNRQPTMGGFFSSSPGSIFGSSSAPRSQQQPQQKQQQKSSFFGLSSNIATESITNDLFGIFKGSETTKCEEHPQSQSVKSRHPSEPSDIPEKTENENTHLFPADDVKSFEDPGVAEKGLMEKAEKTDKMEEEETSLTESISKHEAEPQDKTHTDNLEVSDKDPPPQAPETKGIFELPSLTAPKFGFMTAASEGTPSIGSLFSAIPSSTVKSSQPEQTDGGFFSGFKNLSASILQEEKPSGKDEKSDVSSVFGKKLGSFFGSSDPPKVESPPPADTVQPQSENREEPCEPESDKHSPGSGETESADVSDTEGPTETSKTGSCDTLAQSPQSGLHSLAGSLAEALEKPQPTVIPCEVVGIPDNTPDTVHADLKKDQPKDLLKQEAAKRLVQFMINGLFFYHANENSYPETLPAFP